MFGNALVVVGLAANCFLAIATTKNTEGEIQVQGVDILKNETRSEDAF
jgi:hypothetical protein